MVLPAKKAYGSSVFLAGERYPGPARYEEVTQLSPVLVVAIDNQRHLRIFFDVPESLESLWRYSFGLFIDGREKLLAVEGEAYGNNERLAAGVGRGEVGHTSGAEKSCDVSV